MSERIWLKSRNVTPACAILTASFEFREFMVFYNYALVVAPEGAGSCEEAKEV